CNGLVPTSSDRFGNLPQSIFIQSRDGSSRIVHAFRDLENIAFIGQHAWFGCRAVMVAIKDAEARNASGRAHNCQRITESACRDNRSPRTSKGKNGVAGLCSGGDKAMRLGEQAIKRKIELISGLVEAVHDALSQVAGRSQRLANNSSSFRFVENDDVSKGTANINRKRVHLLSR